MWVVWVCVAMCLTLPQPGHSRDVSNSLSHDKCSCDCNCRPHIVIVKTNKQREGHKPHLIDKFGRLRCTKPITTTTFTSTTTTPSTTTTTTPTTTTTTPTTSTTSPTTTTTTPTTTTTEQSIFSKVSGKLLYIQAANRTKRFLPWQVARTECMELQPPYSDLATIENSTVWNDVIFAHTRQFPTPTGASFWTGSKWNGTISIWVPSGVKTDLPASIETMRVTLNNPCGRIWYSVSATYSHRGTTCDSTSAQSMGYICEIYTAP